MTEKADKRVENGSKREVEVVPKVEERAAEGKSKKIESGRRFVLNDGADNKGFNDVGEGRKSPSERPAVKAPSSGSEYEQIKRKEEGGKSGEGGEKIQKVVIKSEHTVAATNNSRKSDEADVRKATGKSRGVANKRANDKNSRLTLKIRWKRLISKHKNRILSMRDEPQNGSHVSFDVEEFRKGGRREEHDRRRWVAFWEFEAIVRIVQLI